MAHMLEISQDQNLWWIWRIRGKNQECSDHCCQSALL